MFSCSATASERQIQTHRNRVKEIKSYITLRQEVVMRNLWPQINLKGQFIQTPKRHPPLKRYLLPGLTTLLEETLSAFSGIQLELDSTWIVVPKVKICYTKIHLKNMDFSILGFNVPKSLTWPHCGSACSMVKGDSESCRHNKDS